MAGANDHDPRCPGWRLALVWLGLIWFVFIGFGLALAYYWLGLFYHDLTMIPTDSWYLLIGVSLKLIEVYLAYLLKS